LYLANESYVYQIYLEPKGSQLLDQDQWKEDLLTSISPENIDVIGENDRVKLYGVRFYTQNDGRNIRDDLKKLNIL
uniref:hypothetical protein n=1 Tax=Weissella viridescens TaxID=1629 RepID=UPI003AA844F7